MSKQTATKKISNAIKKLKHERNTALIEYVKDHKFTNKIENIILKSFKYENPNDIKVYRGNKDDTTKISKNKWFSCTKKRDIAFTEFAGDNCCVFEINIVNCKTIDVNKYVSDKIGDYKDEDEILILGNGNFYKDSQGKKRGYNYLGKDKKYNKDYYETWYIVKDKSRSTSRSNSTGSINKVNVDRTIELLRDELEFIESISDLEALLPKHIKLNSKEKKDIMKKIKEIKEIK